MDIFYDIINRYSLATTYQIMSPVSIPVHKLGQQKIQQITNRFLIRSLTHGAPCIGIHNYKLAHSQGHVNTWQVLFWANFRLEIHFHVTDDVDFLILVL